MKLVHTSIANTDLSIPEHRAHLIGASSSKEEVFKVRLPRAEQIRPAVTEAFTAAKAGIPSRPNARLKPCSSTVVEAEF